MRKNKLNRSYNLRKQSKINYNNLYRVIYNTNIYPLNKIKKSISSRRKIYNQIQDTTILFETFEEILGLFKVGDWLDEPI